MIFTRSYLFSNSNYFSFVYSSETRIVPKCVWCKSVSENPWVLPVWRLSLYEDSIVGIGVVSAKGQTEKLGWVGLTLENVSSTSIRGMVFKAGVWRDIVQMWRLRSHQIAQIYQSGKELSAQNSGVRDPEEDQGQTSQFPTRSLMPHGFWYHMS